MEIRRFQEKDMELWDPLVWKANNGTLFHTRRFLGYHPPDRFKDHSLIFEKKGQPYVLFPAAEITGESSRIMVSHPGASMGSFVVPEDLAFADSYLLVEKLLDYAKRQEFTGIQLTLPPTIYNRRLSNYMDFSLIKHGFDYKTREISSILFLEDTIEGNLNKFRSSHKRAVRKAEQLGIKVRMTEDYEAFYRILKKNLKIRHGVSPTHSLDELKHLKAIFPDRIHLHGAFLDNQMIAGVVNFMVTDDVILAFYISHDEDYQEYRSVNLLFYGIFQWAIQSGYKVFDFGIFTINEEPNFGLGRFKENFGASGMFRDTLSITL